MNEGMNGEEYLALAKQLKGNREFIRFGEDKENEWEAMDCKEDRTEIKCKLNKVKTRGLPTQ